MSTPQHHRRLRSTSEGCASSRQPSWDRTSAPIMADVYAKKPLPPLPKSQNSLKGSPVPAPLNIRKNRSKRAATNAALPPTSALTSALALAKSEPLPASSSSATSPATKSPTTATTATTRPSPVVDASIDPGRTSSPCSVTSSSNSATTSPASLPHRTSTVSIVSRRSSNKVLQLIGHDVDVMNGTYPWYSDTDIRLLKQKKPARSNSSRSGFDTAGPDFHNVGRIPEEDTVPPLEADRDGTSSQNSSYSPSSPLSVAMTSGPSPHDEYSDAASDGSLHRQQQHQDYLLEDMSLSDVAGEYHRFAAELAVLTERKPPADETTETRIKRMSAAFLSFSTNAQFSRRRNRPNPIDPSLPARPFTSGGFAAGSYTSGGIKSLSASERPPLPVAVLEEHLPLHPPPTVPHSAFDADSDSERRSRSRWGRDRARDDASRPRTWSRTGDQMRDLLTSAKDKARGLPATRPTTRGRRELKMM